MNTSIKTGATIALDLARISFGIGLGSGLNLPLSYVPPREVMDEALASLRRLRAMSYHRKTGQALTVAALRFYEAALATNPLERHRLLRIGGAMLKREPLRSMIRQEPRDQSPWDRSRATASEWLRYAAWNCSLAYKYASSAEGGKLAMSSFSSMLVDIRLAGEAL